MELHLEDLLKVKKKTWVRLEDKIRIELFEKVLKKTRSLRKFAKLLKKELNIKGAYSNIYKWYKGKRPNKDNTKVISHGIPLHVLKFLSNFTGVSMSEIEKHVDFIKGDGPANKVFNPKFPIVLNEATASVISHTLHDGYLEPGKLRVVYSNKEKENLEHFKESVIKMFNASKVEFGEILDLDGVTRIDVPNIVGYVLFCFSLKPGNKIENDTKIPYAILNAENIDVISAFLGVLIGDEGNVQPNRNCGGEIHIGLNGAKENKPPSLLVGDHSLFNKIGVSSNNIHLQKKIITKKGKIHYRWYFLISGQRNLITLAENVRIPTARKQQDLENILSSYEKLYDSILLNDKFRLELFNKVLQKINNSTFELSSLLCNTFSWNVSEASINDWKKGRYHCPIEVVVVLMKMINLSLNKLLKNVSTYKPLKNSRPIQPDKSLLRTILNEQLDRINLSPNFLNQSLLHI